MELTLLAAVIAGLVSFISPCCLPVVPAYLGQLGVVAVAGSRWRALPNAVAFVLGFGLIFTLLGTTAYVAAGPLRDNLPLLRQVGGVVLIVLGLNLMGVLRLRTLWRSWRPVDHLVPRRPGAQRGGVVAGFGLGAIFAIGWTPCIGPTLGAILTLSAIGGGPEVIALLVAYSVGLGIPFLAMALAVERVRALTAPLLRHARLIEMIGGGLVVLIGVAILFDWLTAFARAFSFLWPQV